MVVMVVIVIIVVILNPAGRGEHLYPCRFSIRYFLIVTKDGLRDGSRGEEGRKSQEMSCIFLPRLVS